MKEDLIIYIKACQEGVDKSPSREHSVALNMGSMSIGLNLNGHGELIKELITEMQDEYPVVKYFGRIEE